MPKSITCPLCKSIYDNELKRCTICKYPFSASENERNKYVAHQIMKRSKMKDNNGSIKSARNILFIIGGLQMLISLLLLAGANENKELLIEGIIILFMGIVFISFGFLSKTKPLISLVIPLFTLLILYTVEGVIDPASITTGIVFKFIVIFVLGMGVLSVHKAQKMTMENEYLKKHKEE